MLIELKKGNKIYIKPKNRGKFTKYCHGKVTDECILKGKKSPNAAIRKRATFADNARHFKHQEGGLIFKAQEGTNTNLWANFLSSESGLNLIGNIMNLPGMIALNSELDKAEASYDKELNFKYNPDNFINDDEIWKEVEINKLMLELLNPDVHFGLLDLQQMFGHLKRLKRLKIKQQTDYLKLLEKKQYADAINSMRADNLTSIANGILSNGMGIFEFLGGLQKTSTPKLVNPKTASGVLYDLPSLTTYNNVTNSDFWKNANLTSAHNSNYLSRK